MFTRIHIYTFVLCVLTFAACSKDKDTSGGGTQPSDLAALVNSIEPQIVEDLASYCAAQCTGSQSELCEDDFGDDRLSEDDAACIFIESSAEELDQLETYYNCLKTASTETQMCLTSLTSCDDDQANGCLEAFDNNGETCEMLQNLEYQLRINVACFGQEPDFDCMDGTGIQGDFVCDGDEDCENGADEANCE